MLKRFTIVRTGLSSLSFSRTMWTKQPTWNMSLPRAARGYDPLAGYSSSRFFGGVLSRSFTTSANGIDDADPLALSIKTYMKAFKREEEESWKQIKPFWQGLVSVAKKRDRRSLVTMLCGYGFTKEESHILSDWFLDNFHTKDETDTFILGGTIWHKKGAYYVNRKMEKDLAGHLINSRNNFGVTAARQVGKSTTSYQASFLALSKGTPVLYCEFPPHSNISGGGEIWDEKQMFNRMMVMFKRWIDTCATEFAVLDVSPSFKWSYDELGFDLLLKELKRNSGKPVSIIIDELQCIRGSKDGAKAYLQNKLPVLRLKGLLGCFVGVGTTGLLNVGFEDGKTAPSATSLWHFYSVYWNDSLFFTVNDIEYILKSWTTNMKSRVVRPLIIEDEKIGELADYFYFLTKGYPSLVQHVGFYLDNYGIGELVFESIEQFHDLIMNDGHLQAINTLVLAGPSFRRFVNWIREFKGKQDELNILHWFLIKSRDAGIGDLITLPDHLNVNIVKTLADYGILFPTDSSLTKFLPIPPLLSNIIYKSVDTFYPSMPRIEVQQYVLKHDYYLDMPSVVRKIFSDETLEFRRTNLTMHRNSHNGTSEYGYQSIFSDVFSEYHSIFDEVNIWQIIGRKSGEGHTRRCDFVVSVDHPESMVVPVEILIQQQKEDEEPHNEHYYRLKDKYMKQYQQNDKRWKKSKYSQQRRECQEGWLINIDEWDKERSYKGKMIGVGSAPESTQVHVIYVRLDRATLKLREMIVDGHDMLHQNLNEKVETKHKE